ncbi:MAG: polyphosphate kinase, partial [Sphingomonas sp.]|nr:polyphosphate kinase [Sphingomonas sp.]
LPKDGDIAVFDRSWYGRVLVERVEGYASEPDWKRGFDEINEFEAQQADSGTTIVKLFLHVTQAEQDKRLKDRLNDPWKRWKTGHDDYRNRARRADYLDAMAEMFRRTHTRWGPWHVIDGNDKKAARIAALTVIADRLEAAVPMDPPPLDPELEKVARRALGID